MNALSTKARSADKQLETQVIQRVLASSIDIPNNHRKHSRSNVEAMAENMAVHGQQQPIEIVRRSDAIGRFWLIFGSLRLQAVNLNGGPLVDAVVREEGEFAAESTRRLRSISENMARVSLTALDRAVAIADWCDIYRAAQPRLKPGPKPSGSPGELSLNFRLNSADAELMEASGQFAASFSDAAQAFLGISRAGVFRAIKIGSISSLQRDRISLTWLAKNEGELYRLATVKPADRQVSIIDLILGERASSVEDAIALLDGKTRNRPAKWEVVHQRFSRLPAGEQDHFFDLNEAAIIRWQTKRGAR